MCGATAASAIDEAASAAAASEVTVARRLDVVNISKVAQNNNQVFDVAYYQNPETKVVIEAKVLNKMTSDPDEDDEELSHLVLKQQSLEDQKQEYSRFNKKNQELFNNNYPAVCRLCLYQNNQKITTTIIKTRRNKKKQPNS